MPTLTTRVIQNILDSACAIMHADCGSIQQYDNERNALKLMRHQGLDAIADTFAWVFPHSQTSCAAVLRARQRVIVPDLETCDTIPICREAFRACKVRSVQSTPLIATNGHLVGMVSTYWRSPYQPSDREFDLFDVWVRQTVDTFANHQEFSRLLQEVNQRIGDSNRQVERCNKLVERLDEEFTRMRLGWKRSKSIH